jgi:hypothetical protein
MYAFILGASEAGGPFCFGMYLAWKTSLPSAVLMKVSSAIVEFERTKIKQRLKRGTHKSMRCKERK